MTHNNTNWQLKNTLNSLNRYKIKHVLRIVIKISSNNKPNLYSTISNCHKSESFESREQFLKYWFHTPRMSLEYSKRLHHLSPTHTDTRTFTGRYIRGENCKIKRIRNWMNKKRGNCMPEPSSSAITVPTEIVISLPVQRARKTFSYFRLFKMQRTSASSNTFPAGMPYFSSIYDPRIFSQIWPP